MPDRSRSGSACAAKARADPFVERTIADGEGWALSEFICRAGPSDRTFEERHDGFSVSAVVEGSFSYRSDAGLGLLYPGALLLGNSGKCFECSHQHGVGDRCISVRLREDLFEEIAASAAATSRFRFSAPNLPPSAKLLPIVALLEALSLHTSPSRTEELAIRLVEGLISAMADCRPSPGAASARETRRIAEAIRFIESDVARPLQLQDLAAIAGMSKYHFLRVFRRLVGMTPYQYLISARTRRAALDLASTRRPVLAIAVDSGFGDLSTFNKRFRGTFGATPTKYRASTA
jgi:AraC family transcriptional regulator